MKKFSTSLRILSLGLLLGTLAVLSACSGGSSGGSGGGDTPAPPPAPTLKAWQGAALIETDNAGDALEPKVSFDASGNAMAVWLQSDGSRSNVMARRYTASTTQWSTVTLVDTLDTDASAPEVAMDASGNAIVVWSQPELVSAASSGDIWVRHYTASSKTWSDAMLLETISGLADQVNIATDVSGNAMAVWVQLDASGVKNIWSRYFNRSTGTWATTQLVEIVDSGDASDPRIAFSSAGKAMVVWQQQIGANAGLYSSQYNAIGNTWSASQPIGISSSFNPAQPQIALQSNGNATVVWTQYDGVRFNIHASNYSATTRVWGTPTIILDTTAGSGLEPQVAVDASGNVTAVWVQTSNFQFFDIWSNTFTASTGKWGTATLLEADNTSSANKPQIAMDSSGNATVVWSQSRDTWARRISAGQSGTAFMLGTDNRGNTSTPQIAFDTNGNAMAVWMQSDGTRFNIWANIFK